MPNNSFIWKLSLQLNITRYLLLLSVLNFPHRVHRLEMCLWEFNKQSGWIIYRWENSFSVANSVDAFKSRSVWSGKCEFMFDVRNFITMELWRINDKALMRKGFKSMKKTFQHFPHEFSSDSRAWARRKKFRETFSLLPAAVESSDFFTTNNFFMSSLEVAFA